MPDKHAFLSPSSSERWFHCPPSARLCEQFPDQGSVYASEGTEAHRLCEFLLNQMLGRPDTDPRPGLQYYTPEMEEAARGYVQFISEKIAELRSLAANPDASASGDPIAGDLASADSAAADPAASADPQVYVEQRVDLRLYIPESMGTADCVIIAGNTAQIIDFKYGFHPVPATSLQLRLYALGACELFGALYNFTRVRMAVFQPRLAKAEETEMTVEDLYRWAEEELSPRARQAFDGAGAFACGDWCRCCRARRTCRALADFEFDLDQYGRKDPALLTDAEVADVLSRVDGLVAWAEDVRNYALREALKGHALPGWKVVEGRKGNRCFTDDALVARKVTEAGQNPYEQKLLGISAMEKRLGRKAFADLLSDLVSRPSGKPTLVPLSDKREPMNLANIVFADAKEEDEDENAQ